MTIFTIINGLPTSVWLVLALAALINLSRTPAIKGYLGELLVRICSRFMLDKVIYRRLHNVTLPTPDGTTQIDHILVSQFGIFVLETKNMRGWIFGSENQATWTQKIYKQTFKFQNPLRQNYKHVKALESALELPPETVHSVVIFIGGSDFKTVMPANVTSGLGFISYVKSFQEIVFNSEQVEELQYKLLSSRLTPTYATHREHVRNLQTRSDPTASRLCPRCGSALLIRTVSKGDRKGEQFWGCSGYPKCRTMQSIS